MTGDVLPTLFLAGLQVNFSKWADLPMFFYQASLIVQLAKNPPARQETLVRFLGQEDRLEKGNATHSSILGLPLWLSW